jgi:hypothetical protein
MVLLFHYEQHKVQKKNDSPSYCEFRLYEDDKKIIFMSTFDLHYHRWGVKKSMLYNYSFIVNVDTGDIETIRKIVNDKYNETGFHTSKSTTKKNDFKELHELIHNSLIKGEKTINYWGVKYNRAMERLFNVLYDKLKDKLNQNFLKTKVYKLKYEVNPFYDFLVDFHLDKKGIKGHDNVYDVIKFVYPKMKWLKLNENKFLPAALDSLGIKTKYFISTLNQNKDVNLLSLKYLCKLFGDNYIDYIQQIDWATHSYDEPHNKKFHYLKNDSEKRHMVMLINDWNKDTLINVDSLIHNVNNLLSIREKLEQRGLLLKFKVKDDYSLGYTLESWLGIVEHFKNGYKMKFIYPESFIGEVEKEITIDEHTYKPKMLISEEDFRLEGYIMKNCMGKQFNNGIIHQYVSLDLDKKRINLQFKLGKLITAYGKANTEVPTVFDGAIKELEKRFEFYKDVTWTKEKYDFIG